MDPDRPAAWLGLVAAAVLELVENGVAESSALLLGVVFNLLVALILCGVLRRRRRYLQFPATPPQPSTHAPRAHAPKAPGCGEVMMAADIPRRSKPESPTAQIWDEERQVLNRRGGAGVRAATLVRKIHRQMTAPATLLLAGGIGFILWELTKRQTADNPPAAGTTPLRAAISDFGSRIFIIRRETWGDLTDDELDQIAGKREILLGKIQEKYGIAQEEAEKRINEFEKAID